MLVAMAISMFIYNDIDKKFKLTKKISCYITVQEKWKPFFCICIVFLSIFIIGILGLFIVEIPDFIYSILTGIVVGIGVAITTKIDNRNNKQGDIWGIVMIKN